LKLFITIIALSFIGKATSVADGICHEYSGKAFGICNAYCIAQECHEGNGNGKSCTKLKEQFQKSTGQSFFPCEVPEVPCPCWTQDYLEEAYDYFSDNPNKIQLGYGAAVANLYYATPHASMMAVGGGSDIHFWAGGKSLVFQDPTSYECWDQSAGGIYRPITREEYEVCVRDIRELQIQLDREFCQLEDNPESLCPCWVNGLPQEQLGGASFYGSPYFGYYKLASMTFDRPEIPGYSAQASNDGTFECRYFFSKPVFTDVLRLSITDEEFSKCYNDALERVFLDTDNDCADAAFP
jgi:hypothetical protein